MHKQLIDTIFGFPMSYSIPSVVSVCGTQTASARRAESTLSDLRPVAVPRACVAQSFIHGTQEFARVIIFVLRAALFTLAAVLLCRGNLGLADEKVEKSELPKLTDMKLPSAAELLKADDRNGQAFDWIVLTAPAESDRTVLVVSPLEIRPDTLKKMAETYAQVEASKPKTPEERTQRTARLESLKQLVVKLPGNAVAEYALPVSQIDHIILFEELMLRRVDELLKEGDIRTAYELLLRVEQEIPGWELSKPRLENLLLVESGLRAREGDTYAALALLDELANRNINNPDLRPRFGELVSPMIEAAVAEEDFSKARYLISRIERVYPGHETGVLWQTRMQKIAGALLADAQQKTGENAFAAAAELARKAELIWPSSGNARAFFIRAVARYQILRVATIEPESTQIVFPAPRESDERSRELVEVPLFEPTSADELTYFRSSFFEVWDPTDLGREVVFTLRSTRPTWQSQPILTANQIADALGQRMSPGSPLFNSRLASFVREVSVRSPSEMRIGFSRVPLSIESLLRFPIVVPASEPIESVISVERADNASAGPAKAEGMVADAVSNPDILLSTRFVLADSDERNKVFQRQRPEPDGLDPSKYHIAEIREVRFEDRDEMLKAMVRGEIDYLSHLLPWEVDAFRAAPAFDVRQYALPITHVITFNPLSERIISAQLRRALSFAIDRETILKSLVLRDQAMRYGRLSSAPWHLGSYATNPLEQPPEFNLRLAYALRYAAERQLQLAELTKLETEAKAKAREAGAEFESAEFRKVTNVDYVRLPGLRMVVDPDPTSAEAAERIAVYWRKVGVEVELIPGNQPGTPLGDADWDLCYRRVRMEEPLLELWPLLSNDSSFDMNRLKLFPDWMRQELVNLDYASSFVDAQDRLFTIHRHMSAQAFVIPLWEVDEFAVWKKSTLGIPERPMTPYQNIERWIVRP